MENQSPQVSPVTAALASGPLPAPVSPAPAAPKPAAPAAASGASTGAPRTEVSTGAWPTVPPAPAPKPIPGLEPSILTSSTPAAVRTAATPATVEADDPEPVTAIPALAGDPAVATTRRAGLGAIPRPRRSAAAAAPLSARQRSIRRAPLSPEPNPDLVWQPRFAYATATVIITALTVVTLPLWIVLYQLVGSAADGDTRVADMLALCMMLSGGYLTGAALWVVIVEMRGRVRMVDTLARTGEREVLAAPEPADATEAARAIAEPAEPITWDPARIPPHILARVEAQQASAAQTLEASSRLLSSFSSVLKSYGQLPAQVMLLAVALALFVGATVLSLH